MTRSGSASDDPYELVSVRRSDTPAGTQGSDWHRYVIRQGGNEIRGYRQGTLAAVTSLVEQLVVRLNERRMHKGGRTHIVLRGRKPAKA